MPNLGVKQTEESAARQRVVSKQAAIDVLNILAFVETFYLRKISFDWTHQALAVWFYPKDNMVGGAFTVKRRAFNELKEVVYVDRGVVYSLNGAAVYTGREISVRVEISDNECFVVSDVGESFQDGDEDLTGSVRFAVKLDLKKFPKQHGKGLDGMLTFRLKNGQEYRFQRGQ